MIKKINPLRTAIASNPCKLIKHDSYAKLYTDIGANINTVAKEACAYSDSLKMPIVFTFNRIPLSAKPGMNPKDIVNLYFKEYGRQKVGNSFDCDNFEKLVEAEQKQRATLVQNTANELLKLLKSSLKKGEASIVEWVGKFDQALFKGANVDKKQMKTIIQMLKSQGYLPDDAANLPKEDYKNKSVLARYLIGQFMMWPGHDCAKQFVDLYAKL